MERCLCIHGHFYQPPRENPWLEEIEIQDSAHPYHDWNQRIAAECYAPNTASRIVDSGLKIAEIVDNYSVISFDFGPTLLSWLETADPGVYKAIIEADRRSAGLRSGHGNALAQAYNHVIMPLANRRDKRTQVIWGIRDFEHRFGRFPEGMWLPETAVDLETLGILAELGIKFTVLSQTQALRHRKKGTRNWIDAAGAAIDPSMPYLCRLPGGRRIVLFFYDGPISRAIAFEKLLESGETFARRCTGGFSDSREWPQLVSVATDGESYGHHHPHGDMALASALRHIESSGLAQLTNFGEYLEHHPPTHEAEIIERSSWSCIHGIERWRGDCGCNSGGHPGWNQQWRGPLRDALEWLRDQLAFVFEHKAKEYVRKPWLAREDYINIVLDRSDESIDAFIVRHAAKRLDDAERVKLLMLFEMQRHSMLMFTSCGWFFDELSGIETVQVLQYAGRAIQLARGSFGDSLEASFLDRLKEAKSNLPEHEDGARIYVSYVKPAMIDLKRVAAHYAVSSLFEEYEGRTRIFSYDVSQEEYRPHRAGRMTLAVGRIGVSSVITRESERICFSILHLGDHLMNGGVRTFTGEEYFISMAKEIEASFEAGDIGEVMRLMDKHFGMHNYSLLSLFRDEQRKIAGLVINAALEPYMGTFRTILDHHRVLMAFLSDIGMPLPKILKSSAEISLGDDISRAFSGGTLDMERVREIASDLARWGLAIDEVNLELMVRQRAELMMERLVSDPSDMARLMRLIEVLQVLTGLPGSSLWRMQNLYFRIAGSAWVDQLAKAASGDAVAGRWVNAFRELGERLSFNTAAVLPGAAGGQ